VQAIYETIEVCFFIKEEAVMLKCVASSAAVPPQKAAHWQGYEKVLIRRAVFG
jgi:hypothetical protein